MADAKKRLKELRKYIQELESYHSERMNRAFLNSQSRASSRSMHAMAGHLIEYIDRD